MHSVSNAVTPQRIADYEKIIRPHVRRTLAIEIDAADFGLNFARLYLKLELFQHSGSFKACGAFANLLTRKVPSAGVVAASGGNHGAAVAFAANKLRIPAKIFVPSVSSPVKIARIRDYGADLVIEGDRYADALAASEAWARETGALPVHAFDQDETIWDRAASGSSSMSRRRYRYTSGGRRRRRPDRGDRRLVWRPHQSDRRRAIGRANADHSVASRTAGRRASRRARRGLTRAVPGRRACFSDRKEHRASHRPG
jgi:hypothetical protein